jgi:hypothetical protein
LVRGTFHLASKRDRDALRRDVRPVCTGVNAEAARAALDELTGKRGKRHGAIIRLRESAWSEFIPFLDYDAEIRKVICPTSAIESLNAATGGRSGPAATSRVLCGGTEVPSPSTTNRTAGNTVGEINPAGIVPLWRWRTR